MIKYFLWSARCATCLWGDPKWAVRSCWKERMEQNLLQSKHAGLTSFRWPVVLIDHNFFLQLLYATHQGFPISQSCSDPKWAMRWCLEEKIWQNLLQSKPAGLTSFRWPVVLIDHNFFLQLLYATHQGFTISQRTHLTKVSITLL